jgi:hypothetical protein
MEVGWQCWSAQELVAVRTQDATSAAVSGACPDCTDTPMRAQEEGVCELGRTVRIPDA